MKKTILLLLTLNSTAVFAEGQIDLSSLTSSLDFTIALPLVLAAGAAVIGWDVIKGAIMGVIGMISTATRR